MRVLSTPQSISEISVDALIVGLYSGNHLTETAKEIDRVTNGLISQLMESKEFSGECGETLSLYVVPGVAATILVLLGLGPESDFQRAEAFQSFGTAAKLISQKQRGHVGIFLESQLRAELIESAVAGCVVGCLGQDLYRTQKKQFPFEQLSCCFKNTEAVKNGQIIGESINVARGLVNEPPDVIYPFSFAAKARAISSEVGLDFELWDQGRMQTENCDALLAVAKGSDRLPCLVMMRHQGAASKDDHWLALVGKGVTFDSGGLSLKTNDSMKTMKSDMAGAATVVAAMQAIAELDLPINVMGLVGLVENMPSSKSFKLGDVVRAKNGKTIEVLNTDAEGRMVLADVLTIAVESGADRIIDLATLTGACVVALGQDVVGAMSNDDSWCQDVMMAAETCGELMWQLPMFDEYASQIKSDIADIKNVGNGRWGGAITAAKFLEEFVGDVPWVHLDMAGPAFASKPKNWMDAGATGAMVRTMIEVVRTIRK